MAWHRCKVCHTCHKPARANFRSADGRPAPNTQTTTVSQPFYQSWGNSGGSTSRGGSPSPRTCSAIWRILATQTSPCSRAREMPRSRTAARDGRPVPPSTAHGAAVFPGSRSATPDVRRLVEVPVAACSPRRSLRTPPLPRRGTPPWKTGATPPPPSCDGHYGAGPLSARPPPTTWNLICSTGPMRPTSREESR